jgi:hypothetical protein
LIVVLIINKHFFCLFNRKKGLFDLTRVEERERERHGALVSQSKLVVFIIIINIILVDIIIRLDSDCLVLSSGSSPSSGR